MRTTFQVRAERTVTLEELHMLEVFVLPEYEIEAEDDEEALEEFYWHAPILDHSHFKVQIVGGRT